MKVKELKVPLSYKEGTCITLLKNAPMYYLDRVIIVFEPGGIYRLLVFHKGKALTNLAYKSFRGAKIAFGRLYKEYGYSEELCPEWSARYAPDPDWLEEKRAIAAKDSGSGKSYHESRRLMSSHA